MSSPAVNPSGRLPIGIPDHPGGQPGTYLAAPLAWYSEGVSNLDPRPLFPFGHGLGYTTFTLGELKLSATEVAPDGVVEVSVVVSNTGSRSGAEGVQLYLSDPVAQVTRPIKQLIGYVKVAIDPQQARRVTFRVHMDRTSFTGLDFTRIVEPGRIDLSVGRSSEDRPLLASLNITGVTRTVPEGRELYTPVEVSDF